MIQTPSMTVPRIDVPTVPALKVQPEARTQVSSALTLMSAATLPGLAAFGLKVVSNPAFWVGSRYFVFPEVALIAIVLMAAIMGMLTLPRFASQVMSGKVNGEVKVQQQTWTALAIAATAAQFAVALAVSSVTCHG